MNLDFITQLWSGAQRVPANLPPAHPPKRSLDDRWQVAGRSPIDVPDPPGVTS